MTATLDAAGIARRIRRLRHDRAWTEADLADAVGAHLHTVVLWETGPRVPRVEFCVRLADALDVSLDHLVRGYPCDS